MSTETVSTDGGAMSFDQAVESLTPATERCKGPWVERGQLRSRGGEPKRNKPKS